jgi:hypothetical protein
LTTLTDDVFHACAGVIGADTTAAITAAPAAIAAIAFIRCPSS